MFFGGHVFKSDIITPEIAIKTGFNAAQIYTHPFSHRTKWTDYQIKYLRKFDKLITHGSRITHNVWQVLSSKTKTINDKKKKLLHVTEQVKASLELGSYAIVIHLPKDKKIVTKAVLTEIMGAVINAERIHHNQVRKEDDSESDEEDNPYKFQIHLEMPAVSPIPGSPGFEDPINLVMLMKECEYIEKQHAKCNGINHIKKFFICIDTAHLWVTNPKTMKLNTTDGMFKWLKPFDKHGILNRIGSIHCNGSYQATGHKDGHATPGGIHDVMWPCKLKGIPQDKIKAKVIDSITTQSLQYTSFHLITLLAAHLNIPMIIELTSSAKRSKNPSFAMKRAHNAAKKFVIEHQNRILSRKSIARRMATVKKIHNIDTYSAHMQTPEL